jgi:dephospho-CoA kinase
MGTTLVTGMSGVGKSSVVHELRGRGCRAVDLDSDDWSHLVPDDSAFAVPGEQAMDWRWREGAVRALLEDSRREVLVVAGTATNQARFHHLLDHVVLLSLPEAVALDRLAHRTTNDYGKDPAELRRELELRAVVEPLLRASACLEIDSSTVSVSTVAAMVLEHARSGPPCLLGRTAARSADQE